MRSPVLPLVLLTALSACAPTTASNQTIGHGSFDRSTRTLYLKGDTYYVPESVGTMGLVSGDRLDVTWQQEGDRRVVQRYSAERDDDRR